MMAVRLRNRMDELGLTNQSLADRAGVPVATVNRIVAGQTENPSVTTLTALASALEMTLDEIVGLMIRSETPVQPSPVVAMYENMTQMLQTIHRSSLQELKAAHAEELRGIEARHRTEVQDLMQQHKQAIDALEAKHSAAMSNMDQQYRISGREKDRWISRQFWLRIVLTGMLIMFFAWIMILELNNPDFGLFRW